MDDVPHFPIDIDMADVLIRLLDADAADTIERGNRFAADSGLLRLAFNCFDAAAEMTAFADMLREAYPEGCENDPDFYGDEPTGDG